MAKVVTFGEIMLRLKSPAYERLFHPPLKRPLAVARRTCLFLWRTTAWKPRS